MMDLKKHGLFTLGILFFVLDINAQITKQLEAKKDKITQLWGYENTGEQEYWWKEAHSQGKSESMMNMGMETEWVIPCQYTRASKEFTEGLAGVEIGGKVGFVDKNNRFIIAPQFEPVDKLKGFSLGLAAVKLNGKFGYINKKGDFIIPPIFDYADNFEEDYLATVKMGNKFGAIDLKGDTVVPCRYLAEEAMKFLPFKNKEYRAAVKMAETRFDDGYYDCVVKSVNEVAEGVNNLIRDSAYVPAMQYTVIVKHKGDLKGLGVQDKDSIWILTPNFREILPVCDGYYCVQDSAMQWGVVDSYGRIILPCKFEKVEYQPEPKLFIVTSSPYKLRDRSFGKRVGLYNHIGALVLPLVFEQISSFEGNVAEACIDNVCGQVDKYGQVSSEFIDKLLGAANTKSGLDYTYYMLRLIGLHPSCAQIHNDFAVMQLQRELYKEGIKRLKLAHDLDPKNEQIAENLKISKSERKERRLNRVIKALEVSGQVINVASATYATVSGNTGASNVGMTGTDVTAVQADATAIQGNGTNEKKRNNRAKVEEKNTHTGAEVALRNRDSNTYRDYETQLIKMNVYYERDYNDRDRKYIQQQMKSIRTKWLSRGLSFSKSEWEDWNGVKR